MGVPSFYRWLVNKYPKAFVGAVEERGGESVETSSPNPNGMEFDNLYLDMNGIIHPCFHPDNSIFPPTSFEEVFNNIYEYIDRLFSIVRPRKLLYLAVDGVAPRAKMNQQRSRRFRMAKDNEIAETEEERLRKEFEMEGKPVLPKQESEASDSNVITPGTKFMYQLSKALQHYIRARIDNDAGWKDIKVILSDANVPGEGEHKIMSFIRQQRNFPDYDPNIHHCLHGLDADLIMLSLATHELYFSILREDVLVQEQKSSSESALATSISVAECSSIKTAYKNPSSFQRPYQFLHVWVLREYLELDMKISNPPENLEMDFERVLDDFIFMCFFTGNDYMPHMPSLEIHEGAIDLMMTVYKKEFKNLGGYLVDMNQVNDRKMGFVKLERVEKFILLVSTYEEKIFKKRSELYERKLKRLLSYNRDDQEEGDLAPGASNDHRGFRGEIPRSENLGATSIDVTSNEAESSSADHTEILKNTKELKEKLKVCLARKADLLKHDGLGTDKVKLGSAGFKARYYEEKFSVRGPEDIESTRKLIVQKYTEGLLWVLQYCFSGVPSWTWFYPYHYGPFASDLKGLAHTKVTFQKGTPFKPFDQLMGVLPPRSAQALPEAYQKLMTDEKSNIMDFYPTSFEIDTNGKRFTWQGVCKLPFIDEKRLLDETKNLEKDLGEEALRNAVNDDLLFVTSSSKLGSQILALHPEQASQKKCETVQIDARLSDGVSGFMHPFYKNSDVGGTTTPTEFHDVQKDRALLVFYQLPNVGPHIPRLLAGVEPPLKIVTEADIMETQLWHEYHGCKPPITRFQVPGSYKREINSQMNEISIHRVAGSGWAGRGKAIANISDSRGQIEPFRKFPIGDGERFMSSSFSAWSGKGKATSSSWIPRGGSVPVTSICNRAPSSTSRGMSASKETWKEASPDQGIRKPMRNMSLPDSSQGFRSYGRAQPVNNTFAPQQSYNASPYSQGRGRGPESSADAMSYAWRHSSHLAADPLKQASGSSRGSRPSTYTTERQNRW